VSLDSREVHLSRKDRKLLEACCCSPVTLQRDLKRARIVLLAAAGRSTRSISQEVGLQAWIVNLWRHRYADHGLGDKSCYPAQTIAWNVRLAPIVLKNSSVEAEGVR
jgi:hypothetical protein